MISLSPDEVERRFALLGIPNRFRSLEKQSLSTTSLVEHRDRVFVFPTPERLVPSVVLRKLGIKPLTTQEFRLADGSAIRRKKGIALFKYQDKVGGADVIFGEEGDSLLLGAFTLEALGRALDLLRRELKPLPMILSGKI